MKRPIFALLTALVFTVTLCACATESVKGSSSAPQPAKEPVVPVKEAAPVAEKVIKQTGAAVEAAPLSKELSNVMSGSVDSALPVQEKNKKSLKDTGASLPPALQILDFARSQLPKEPIRMNGSLKERAENGFVKKELTVEMDLNWGADPANATYRIRNEKTGAFQTLEIQWIPGGPEFQYSENNNDVTNFNPNTEIDGLGVTWDDLSFSFLWSFDAKTLRTDKKLGRDCFVVAVPRGKNQLLLWIEQDTGRLFGAREEDPAGNQVKELKVVSVKEFDKLWMVKDLDIIRPSENGRTSLRIDTVETVDPAPAK